MIRTCLQSRTHTSIIRSGRYGKLRFINCRLNCADELEYNTVHSNQFQAVPWYCRDLKLKLASSWVIWVTQNSVSHPSISIPLLKKKRVSCFLICATCVKIT